MDRHARANQRGSSSWHIQRLLSYLWLVVAMHPMSASAQQIDQLPVTSAAITADGLSTIDTTQQELRIRSWESLEVVRSLRLPCPHVHDVVLSANQTHLAIAGGNPGESAWVGLYAWPTLKQIWTREFSSDVAYAVAFHPDDQTLAVACHDSSVVVLNVGTAKITAELSGHSRTVTGVTFTAGQHPLLLSGSIDQTIRVWDMPVPAILRSLTNHTQAVTSLAVRPASVDSIPMVASGSLDRSVRFWQPGLGRLVRFKRLTSPVTAIAWTPDGAAVLAGDRDGKVFIIDAETLQTDELTCAADGWINAIAVHPTEPVALIADSTGQLTKLEFDHP